ncbi:CoA-binding protein [Candidatus Sumerlaeota bacterium]|nr:CoA-binding protein [Candidatus Sumerlaeota bacterium]
MEETIDEFLKLKSFAVFGASDSHDCSGYRIVQQLAKKGYTVYPINPRIAKIGSMKCYGTLDELPVVPQIVVINLPPGPALEVMKSGLVHGVRRFWLQPGSESDSVLTFPSENGLQTVHSRCLYKCLGGKL